MAARLAELVSAKIGSLNAAELDVVELVSFGEPIGVDLLAELGSAEALEEVEARRLIVVESVGRRVQARLAHPLYGEMVRQRCPETRGRRRLRELAHAVEAAGARRREDTLRLAIWRLDSGTAHDPVALHTACRSAWAAQDLPLAIRLGWAAVNAGGGVTAATTLATMLNYCERPEEADAALTAVHCSVRSDADRAQLATTRAYTLHYGLQRLADALTLLDDAAQSVADKGARQQIAVQRAELLNVTGNSVAALPHFQQVLAEPSGSVATRTHAAVIATAACGHTGRYAEAVSYLDSVLSSTQDWREVVPFEELRAVYLGYHAHMFAGELTAAEALITPVHDRATHQGEWNFCLGMMAWCRGHLARARGRIREAHRWCREALVALEQDSTVAAFAPACLGDLAHAAAIGADPLGATKTLAEARRRRMPAVALFNNWIDIAQPWVIAASGDLPRAVEHAISTADRTGDAGLCGFQVISLHDAARLGAADAVADRLQRAAESAEGPLPRLCAEHARAAVEHAGTKLLDVSAGFAALGATLLAAEAAANASAVYRSAGSSARATAAATRAWALSRRCEGAWTPALAGLKAPGLTRREREIASLAAACLTSKEIARRLVMSTRTVDNHLGKIYTKLGIEQRSQLKDLLGVPGDRFESL